MTAWRRWQDWATVVLGVVVLATPFVFGIDLTSAAAWTAYVMGVLLVLGGLWSASTKEPNIGIEWIPLVLGIVLFIAPWLLGFTGLTAMAWAAWVIGVLAILNSGGELVFRRTSAA